MPLTRSLIELIFLPVIFIVLKRPILAVTALPCWSSWVIGMSYSSCKRSSIMKQAGVSISSKCSRQIHALNSERNQGIDSRWRCQLQYLLNLLPQNIWKKHIWSPFGFCTESAKLTSSNTMVQLEITATISPLFVYSCTESGLFEISIHGALTHREYVKDK